MLILFTIILKSVPFDKYSKKLGYPLIQLVLCSSWLTTKSSSDSSTFYTHFPLSWAELDGLAYSFSRFIVIFINLRISRFRNIIKVLNISLIILIQLTGGGWKWTSHKNILNSKVSLHRLCFLGYTSRWQILIGLSFGEDRSWALSLYSEEVFSLWAGDWMGSRVKLFFLFYHSHRPFISVSYLRTSKK